MHQKKCTQEVVIIKIKGYETSLLGFNPSHERLQASTPSFNAPPSRVRSNLRENYLLLLLPRLLPNLPRSLASSCCRVWCQICRLHQRGQSTAISGLLLLPRLLPNLPPASTREATGRAPGHPSSPASTTMSIVGQLNDSQQFPSIPVSVHVRPHIPVSIFLLA